MTTLVFLRLNGHWLDAEPETLTAFVIGVAAGTTSKMEASQWLGLHLLPVP